MESIPPFTDNKRLDEWVTEDRLDLNRLQLPRKESKNPTANAIATIKTMSRASSPADTSNLTPPTSVTPVPHEVPRRPSVAGRKRKIEGEVSKEDVLNNVHVCKFV